MKALDEDMGVVRDDSEEEEQGEEDEKAESEAGSEENMSDEEAMDEESMYYCIIHHQIQGFVILYVVVIIEFLLWMPQYCQHTSSQC